MTEPAGRRLGCLIVLVALTVTAVVLAGLAAAVAR